MFCWPRISTHPWNENQLDALFNLSLFPQSTSTCFGHICSPSSGVILTYSMVQSPSWEAKWFAASQEIPRISRNPKVHYRIHKHPPPVSILGQPNPVHIPTSHLLQIHPNIFSPSTHGSPHWSFSLQFPTKNIYTPSPQSYAPNAQPTGVIYIYICIERQTTDRQVGSWIDE